MLCVLLQVLYVQLVDKIIFKMFYFQFLIIHQWNVANRIIVPIDTSSFPSHFPGQYNEIYSVNYLRKVDVILNKMFRATLDKT
jgi:hypothetical protein